MTVITGQAGLMRSASSLSLNEKHLVAIATEKCASQKVVGLKGTQVTAREFAVALGINEVDAYEKMKAALEQLFSRSFSIYEPTSPSEDSFLKSRWVDVIECNKSIGAITLYFSNQISPYLPIIVRNFNTKQVGVEGLRSIYSPPILELCESHIEYCKKTSKPVKVPLGELRRLLKTPESYSWADVRVRAIEKAVQEIHDQGGRYLITVTPYKEGRKVAGVNFYVKEDDQLSLF